MTLPSQAEDAGYYHCFQRLSFEENFVAHLNTQQMISEQCGALGDEDTFVED